MIYILNIETATKNCSVSVGLNGKTIALKELSAAQFNHAEKLQTFIDEILQTAKITFKELKAVAVSKGPGSYTGLRIGVSSAKGFCYALDIPLIAVNTLELLAHQLVAQQGFIVPMIDARRMEVFTQIFDVSKKVVSKPYALIVEENSFETLEGIIHLIGDGAGKCKEVLNDERFKYYDEVVFPSARQMSLLSFEKYLHNDFENTAYFEPYYLKDFMLSVKK